MSDAWGWEYNPDEEHVAGGIPAAVVAVVERLAGELAELASMGADLDHIGYRQDRQPGGLREMRTAGGFFFFLVSPRDRSIVITRIIPPFKDL
ncbi:hypothetical protein [Streptomyces sp. NPDC053048]|uniref:hypothetical protein n=1 Tax=Streptomyces sp. NPDC053048 TaxID=3365694 RepID=UPI0037D972D0